MKLIKNIVTTLAFMVVSVACASNSYQTHRPYNGVDGQALEVEQMITELEDAQVVIVGELHQNKTHQDRQFEILTKLHERGKKRVSVGFEFVSYDKQIPLDDFVADRISVDEFIKQANWGSKIETYLPLLLFARTSGTDAVALNLTRKVTSQVAKKGLKNIDPELKEMIPANFNLENEIYLKRFMSFMGGGNAQHPSEMAMRYFTAQSLWDHTMAWSISNYLKKNPDTQIVIIVGNFHAEFGGGLKDHLIKHGVENIKVVTQGDISNLNDEQVQSYLLPHSEYGVRGDYIWPSK